MNLLDYIRGNRKGREAHSIEKEAMKDPFLYEALEGFDSVDDDHLARLRNIQKKIGKKQEEKKRNSALWPSIAAASILVFSLVGYQLLMDTRDMGLHAHNGMSAPINVYIPDADYTENIAIIAQKNTELTKNISVKFSHYKDEEEMDKELEALEQEIKLIAQAEPAQKPSRETETAMNASAATRSQMKKSAEVKKSDAIEIFIPKGTKMSEKEINLNPTPLIGFSNYEKYLKQEMKRPTDNSCKNKKGTVVVHFLVDDSGKPYGVEVENGLCDAIDTEAIRLVKDGSKWTPTHIRVSVNIEF